MNNGGEKQNTEVGELREQLGVLVKVNGEIKASLKREVEELRGQLGMFVRVNEEIKADLTREKENSRILQEHLQWTVRTYYEAIFCSADLNPPPGSSLHKFLSSVDKASLVEVVRRKNDELQATLKHLADQSQLSSEFFLQTSSLEKNLRQAQREHGQLKGEVKEVRKEFAKVRNETRRLENQLRQARQGRTIAQNRARMLSSKLAREKYENLNLRKWARNKRIV